MPRVIDVSSGLGVGLQSASDTLATANALKMQEEAHRVKIESVLQDMAEKQAVIDLRGAQFDQLRGQVSPDHVLSRKLDIMEQAWPHLSAQERSFAEKEVGEARRMEAFNISKAQIADSMGGALSLLDDLKETGDGEKDHPFVVQARNLQDRLALAEDKDDLEKISRESDAYVETVQKWKTEKVATETVFSDMNKRIVSSGVAPERLSAALNILHMAKMQGALMSKGLKEKIDAALYGEVKSVVDPTTFERTQVIEDPLGVDAFAAGGIGGPNPHAQAVQMTQSAANALEGDALEYTAGATIEASGRGFVEWWAAKNGVASIEDLPRDVILGLLATGNKIDSGL